MRKFHKLEKMPWRTQCAYLTEETTERKHNCVK